MDHHPGLFSFFLLENDKLVLYYHQIGQDGGIPVVSCYCYLTIFVSMEVLFTPILL